MAAIALLLFAVSASASIAEIVIERDWPRDTAKFTITFGIILLLSVSV
jgi:hypothetical protein